MIDDISRVLEFWLKQVGPEGWYVPSETLDATIRDDFLDLWMAGAEGRLDNWITTPRGALALMIVLDQFPRNMFRGTESAFRSDPRALRLTKLAIGMGHDRETPEPERQFFYLPLMHSEMLADQERCVRMIMMRMPEFGADNIEHAIKHRAVIRMFGRFPSRNGALGRRDSDAELSYRDAGGYMS